MPSLPVHIYDRLASTLLQCGPFESDATLHAVFIDSRISAWKDSIPEAHSRAERVTLAIAYLANQTTDKEQNALALFLHVLSERHSPSDSCHQALSTLVDDIAQLPKDSAGLSTYAHRQASQKGCYMRFANLLELSLTFVVVMGFMVSGLTVPIETSSPGIDDIKARLLWGLILADVVLLLRWALSYVMRKVLKLAWMRDKRFDAVMLVIQIVLIIATIILYLL
ncbi:MAG: hypothetical protein ACP5J4_11820 [Anaerolineae bacterium]